MNRKTVSGMILILLLMSMFTLVFNIQPVGASETIYIRANGSIDPPTAPILRNGDIYTFTGNIYDEIVVERENITVDGAGYTVQGSGSGKGFNLNCYNVTIQNVNIKNFEFGIDIDNVPLPYGRNITICDNNISYNRQGIRWWASYCLVKGNVISNNEDGIYDAWGYRNIIIENTISNNWWGFVSFESSGDFLIYHNNFLNNTRQVAFNEPPPNTWDNGYPSGGNYWSDYEERYPEAQELDGSGLWDTQYFINLNNQDNYPLMKPWTPPDIAITDVTLSKTIVSQGYTTRINVTSQNQGECEETFNVTLYANTTQINQTQITLASGASATITFTWNTTGYAKGNYTVGAHATPLPGETDTYDNTHIDGTILVTIAGDVNGDGIVDIFDLNIAGKAYGSFAGDPRYSPEADINSNGHVDMRDIMVIARNYGKTDP